MQIFPIIAELLMLDQYLWILECLLESKSKKKLKDIGDV